MSTSMKVLGGLRTLHNRNGAEYKKSFHRYRNDNFMEKEGVSTPNMKLSTEFSSDRKGRSSDLNGKSRYKQDPDINDTFAVDLQTQISSMEDRMSKLENLVWSLYSELNTKIESTTSSTQLQLEEAQTMTQQVFSQLGEEIGALRDDFARVTIPLNRSGDDGYDGSEEENEDQEPEEEQLLYHPHETDRNYIQGSLDEVQEEDGSQYFSEEEKVEFERDSVDKSDPLLESSRDRMPYDYQPRQESPEPGDNMELLKDYTEPQYYEPNSREPPYSHDSRDRSDTTPEESESNDDLEYYFSCHERMIKDYDRSSSSNSVFKNINKDELRDNFTMPDLSRSTLVDQIDYDLDNFKINESSLYDTSSEGNYGSKRNINTSTLRENKQICTDFQPKLMGFLNKEKILQSSIVKFHK